MSIHGLMRAMVGKLMLAIAVTLMTMASAGCATTGATYRSGVGDRYLEHPPWYAGRDVAATGAGGRLGHLPVVFQRGATQPVHFEPRVATGTPASVLVSDIDAYVDSLLTATGVSVRLVEGGKVSSASSAAAANPPDVQFGCITENGVPWGDCVVPDGGAIGRGRQQMRLAVGRPSAEWIAWMGDVMREQRVQEALVVTLEIGQYQMRQRGILGKKEVELGTGHTVDVPWISSLETPVMVLQLTGALVGPDGKAIRVGSEGFAVRRTRLLVSALGAQELFGDEDLAKARTARRDDLPGAPLAWQVAARHLVAQLTGRRELGP
ncbi:MAG TPA: hypothetical protein VFV33_00910 [Gemmatimonadaceae bacterium]|nr:hypothetical protein [Gemmatimonadaceae bacterium]